MTKFKLHYFCRDGGDGSVSVQFVSTEQETEVEEADEGFGEPSGGSVNLKLEDGKLYFSDYQSVNGKYQLVWKPIEETK